MDTAPILAVCLTVILVIGGIVGALTYDSVLDKRKELRQYELCVESGGTYFKYSDSKPICINGGQVKQLQPTD